MRRNIYVGTDARDVERVAGPLLAKAGPIPADAHVVGEPEAVAEQLRALAAGGYTDAIVREMAVEHADVLASFERLARVQELVAVA